jgi:hypothetical protein
MGERRPKAALMKSTTLGVWRRAKFLVIAP